ncbi:unnamed protein product [Rhizophagus irregularis]|nr:unnamed protein product [Rhizophagus irregularis]
MGTRVVVAIDFGTTFSQPRKTKNLSVSKSVELFKLHLGNLPQNEKTPLPHQLSCEKALFTRIRKGIKLLHKNYFFSNSFYFNYFLNKFDDRAKDTKRKCLYNAGLTNSKESNKIEFTTEPEAAAIYCMRNLEEQNKQNIQSNRNV